MHKGIETTTAAKPRVLDPGSSVVTSKAARANTWQWPSATVTHYVGSQSQFSSLSTGTLTHPASTQTETSCHSARPARLQPRLRNSSHYPTEKQRRPIAMIEHPSTRRITQALPPSLVNDEILLLRKQNMTAITAARSLAFQASDPELLVACSLTTSFPSALLRRQQSDCICAKVALFNNVLVECSNGMS
ncbi:hypothetical protein BC830DRAFT_1080420 [Chytriomyces sp. MP71]|nr:hypothetical protein BC830DRAFT_1080420 [Chytriomyces sp. MP71]